MALERDEPPPGDYRVEGFAGKAIVVGGQPRMSAFLICRDIFVESSAEVVTDLAMSDFDPVLTRDAPPEVLLIGSGAAMAWPDRDLLGQLRDRGAMPEVMDSRAAARTYNLLLSEARDVAALILPLSAD
ncbi:hypothetical protein B5C34_11815 [Pacificimonas flava]|uniref:Uncharacterized protein n=2 Tax=Pacificimonas TaxID=1960290 RepID=A0A219B8K0_9SPHN|nr:MULTISPECIES: Mth938-like domain-containing protein [Pacificimonas]MBZ6378651.1 Mth938-like domain-containing protein [Pacificimonas aurantium]OWV34078.1 hypothetical protein B5C34_11815 [Pacificimonas flava]